MCTEKLGDTSFFHELFSSIKDRVFSLLITVGEKELKEESMF